MDRGYEAIKALKAKLMRETSERWNIPALLALAPKNDPFYAGSPASRRDADWFAGLWRECRFSTGTHLRRIHYRLVSVDQPFRKPDGLPYENTLECWGFLSEAGKQARYLRLVDADAFEDHRNPPPHLYMPHELFRRQLGVELAWEDAWTLPSIESDLGTLLNLALPTVEGVEGYDYAPEDEPYLVEVWVEKSTMDDVLDPLCQGLHVNFVTSVGFQSITSAIQLLLRVRRFRKPARVFYISDFDPAGDRMPDSVARQLEFWLRYYAPNAELKLTPLALTHEQVNDPRRRLPRIPIKETDLRRQGFEDRYGEGAVELDALEALDPGRLAQIVREAILPYRDETLPERLRAVEAEALESARRAWADQTAPVRQTLDRLAQAIQAIVARYQGQLEALNVELQAELAPFHEPIEMVRQAVEALQENFCPALPARPEPDVDEPGEDGWLLDTQRDYLAQLAYYKARKDGNQN